MSKDLKISKYVRERIWDLMLFLSSFSIPVISTYGGLCRGACSSCWLCSVLIPLTLTLALLTQTKQKIRSVISHLKKFLQTH